MTRLDRIIKAFNDYDKLVKRHSLNEEEFVKICKLRIDVSILIDELKLHGCRREN